jgi:hypothetical protein
MPRTNFFLPRALFYNACWSVFLVTPRAILAVFCARPTYTAPVGDALIPLRNLLVIVEENHSRNKPSRAASECVQVVCSGFDCQRFVARLIWENQTIENPRSTILMPRSAPWHSSMSWHFSFVMHIPYNNIFLIPTCIYPHNAPCMCSFYPRDKIFTVQNYYLPFSSIRCFETLNWTSINILCWETEVVH